MPAMMAAPAAVVSTSAGRSTGTWSRSACHVTTVTWGHVGGTWGHVGSGGVTWGHMGAVSYTHLTLPTICSV
eukprot:3553110-Prymnesium_polylepis.1